VGFALIREGAKRLLIANRTLQRAEDLAAVLRGQPGHHVEVVSTPWDSLHSGAALRGGHLLVNCTSLGMKHSAAEGESPLDAHAIPGSVLVCDLVYNPEETPLLRQARKAGAPVLGGLPMLVYQGAASFELWTGQEASVDIMFRKAREALASDA
jgi:shikimate dehydrogenase